MVERAQSAILLSGPPHRVGARSGDLVQEMTVMEPSFIRPVMSNYFANRPERVPNLLSPDQDALSGSFGSSFSRRSLVTRVRQASGALLIACGGYLSGAPRLAYTDPVILATAHMPATNWDTDDAEDAAGLAVK